MKTIKSCLKYDEKNIPSSEVVDQKSILMKLLDLRML